MDDPAGGRQPGEGPVDHGHAEAEPGGDLGRVEGTVRTGVARHQVADRVLDRLEERLGHPDRQSCPEGVAQPTGVLHGDPPLLTGDAHAQGSALALELHQAGGVSATGEDLLGGEVAQHAQQVGHPLDAALGRRLLALGGQPLDLRLDLGHRVGVDQLTELGLAQKLGEQSRVERERLGAALGERGVPLVHESADVAEQQRPGEGGGLLGLDLDQPHLAGFDVLHQPDEARHVEDVLQDLAHRLEHHREAAVLRSDAQQLGRPLPLLPQGGAPGRVASRQQQRP